MHVWDVPLYYTHLVVFDSDIDSQPMWERYRVVALCQLYIISVGGDVQILTLNAKLCPFNDMCVRM